MAQIDDDAAAREADARWTARRLSHWLIEGGDDRLLLDPETGLNRYGCGTAPDDTLMAFGSSTASTISGAGAAAAEDRLAQFCGEASEAAAWDAGAPDLKRRLAEACGLPDWDDDHLILSPSGTDVCRLAADLARGEGPDDLLSVILPEPAETGRGAPAAFCPDGAPIAVAIREADGRPRDRDAVDEEVSAHCAREIGAGRHVLLCVLDVSKTGLIAPSPLAARRLKAMYGERLSVLVDACQFRLGPRSLAAYLDAGFDVAITGSKFLSGPIFSGALLRPRASAAPPPIPGMIPEAKSLGVLLRWEAALAEYEAFRRIPEAETARIVGAFGAAVESALDASPAFERLPAPPLVRFGPPGGTQGGSEGWEALATIFSFLPRAGGRLLDGEATDALFKRLRGVRLGQPVRIGVRDGVPVSALRVALSARQIAAAAADPGGLDRLIDGMRGALARAAAQIG